MHNISIQASQVRWLDKGSDENFDIVLEGEQMEALGCSIAVVDSRRQSLAAAALDDDDDDDDDDDVDAVGSDLQEPMQQLPSRARKESLECAAARTSVMPIPIKMKIDACLDNGSYVLCPCAVACIDPIDKDTILWHFPSAPAAVAALVLNLSADIDQVVYKRRHIESAGKY